MAFPETSMSMPIPRVPIVVPMQVQSRWWPQPLDKKGLSPATPSILSYTVHVYERAAGHSKMKSLLDHCVISNSDLVF